MNNLFLRTLLILAAVFVLATPARALDVESAGMPVPPERVELENIPDSTLKVPKKDDDDDEEGGLGLAFNIRLEALKEAALSYGARGGLAWRTYHIRNELEARQSYMDKVFDFRLLLIAAPSGLLIEPPIVSETTNALIVGKGGQEAAVADRVYAINRNARIVSSARHWRNYLERDWGEVTPPPDILRPSSPEEREKWIEWIREGWKMGIDQADEIFQDDLHQLSADYQGMVRYRLLLAQGMITPPYTQQVDRGVTGGGEKMRVGDRAVQITGAPALMPGSETWQPANR